MEQGTHLLNFWHETLKAVVSIPSMNGPAIRLGKQSPSPHSSHLVKRCSGLLYLNHCCFVHNCRAMNTTPWMGLLREAIPPSPWCTAFLQQRVCWFRGVCVPEKLCIPPCPLRYCIWRDAFLPQTWPFCPHSLGFWICKSEAVSSVAWRVPH